MSQIRLNKSPELQEVLAYLQRKYRVLSEAEIIKVALAEKYKKEIGDIPYVDEETERLIAKGSADYKKGHFTEIKTDEELDSYLKNL
jgi:hypothetical protein